MYCNNKLLYFCVASYFTIISCKNNNNDNLNLEQFSVTLASSKDVPANPATTTAKGLVTCKNHITNFNISSDNNKIYLATNTDCTITFSNIEFVNNSKKYKFTNIEINVNLNNNQYKYFSDTSYPNIEDNNKNFFVATHINLSGNNITINFHDHYQTDSPKTLTSMTFKDVNNVTFNAIEAPPAINLYLAPIIHEDIDKSKTLYNLQTNNESEQPPIDTCIIVPKANLNNKSWTIINDYLKTNTTNELCPDFYQNTINPTGGNWDKFFSNDHYIIISTNPINDELNSYRVIEVPAYTAP
ncbi:MAG: hypothetical protein DCC88_11695 [Spirobacillus cienkowskii]|jgi:hypothetical protein|uniref:Uncharacterized protein n=1 Tax=Spirobacillus cienkowskii TaxID=495820 RepID=A0A369KKJ2_9BACT|nr:MAG: hypothetical protein DCC88_11695 [Spirobacillus cienkowskii]